MCDIADSTVKVSFIGDSSSLKKAVDDADGHLHSLGKSVGNFAKVAAIGLGAAAVGLGVFAKSAIEAAQESAKVTASTEAVIKSTGSAAKVTAKQVAALATAISNKTGIDDEAIQSGQNLLLTFTNLQNRAGKGNDIFNQASSIMVDMAAALGTDASGAAIQLGKALNDPVKGITALTRVGVSFTDQQKKQIKAMQASGDIAGAQKVILAELNTEFGGMAAAQSTAAKRMKVAFGNLQEEIGGMLIPVVEKLSTFLVEKVIPAMSNLANNIAPKIQTAFRYIADAVTIVVTAFKSPEAPWAEGNKAERFFAQIGIVAREVFEWLKANVPPIIAAIGDGFAKVGDIIMNKFWPAIKTTFDFLKDHHEILGAMGALIGVYMVAQVFALTTATWGYVTALWAQAAAFAAANIWWIAAAVAIAALVAGVIYAYEHWGWFHDAVDKAWQIMQKVAHWFMQTFVPFMKNEVAPVIADIGRNIGNIAQKIAGVTVDLWHFAMDVKDVAKDIIDSFIEIADSITAPFQYAFGIIRDLWDKSIGPIYDKITRLPGVPGGGGGGLSEKTKLPGYAMGGIVSGPVGAPQLAIVHGGERVIPNGGGGQAITLNIDGRSFMTWLVDYSRNAGGIPITTRAPS